jgi:hypothetical protein
MADLTGMMQAAAGAGEENLYIEDVFSTYLYTGTGAALTITNGIDLAGEGGLTWIKGRSGATDHALYDTARGATKDLVSNSTAAETTEATGLTAFSGTGFSLGALAKLNTSAATYASWTFRKQEKFFDIVTYTGTGSAQNIAHSLGSTPGCVIVKRTDDASNWAVYHRGLTSASYWILLNNTLAQVLDTTAWNATAPTSTQFTVGSASFTNASGGTYIAYLFAHDAGGFGLTGEDNVISCGSFTTDGSGAATVSLGYEPQWLLVKKSSSTGTWYLLDVMRGLSQSTFSYLLANTSAVEEPLPGTPRVFPTATGFQVNGGTLTSSAETFIYIACRRGPMKVPTTGTSVFTPVASSASTGTTLTTNFPIDAQFEGYRGGDSLNMSINDRLRGVSTTATQRTLILTTSSTAAEASPNATMTNFWDNTGFKMPGYYGGLEYIAWNFRRAPGFFDEVCYTGTGTLGQTYSHNLGVAPELMIVKCRAGGNYNWPVWNKNLAAGGASRTLTLNLPQAFSTDNGAFNSTAPTASVFTVGNNFSSNGGTGYTYVAYLFATCAGVSKVGTYTGTGAAQTINCGFTAGSRFVMIKRTDVSADWYVWDSARGIVAGNDPYLLLNTTDPEVTGTDYVDTAASGFELTSTAPAAINASGGSYIFLAIA